MSTTNVFYNKTYQLVRGQIIADIRQETYGEDIGQVSWMTAEEYSIFFRWLKLSPTPHMLDVASGSGGPALYMAHKHACRITGIDINEINVQIARQAAASSQLTELHFQTADMDKRLPITDNSFDGIMCFDSMGYFSDRRFVLGEWHRILKTGRRILFTDLARNSGSLPMEETMISGYADYGRFMSPETTELLIRQAGFTILYCKDLTENIVQISERWHTARHHHRNDLIKIEGREEFDRTQLMLTTIHNAASNRQFVRQVFVAEK